MERIKGVILLVGILLASGCDKLWVGDDITNDPPTQVEAVDLGLPSGTLWGSQNLLAPRKWDFGGSFAWGEAPADQYILEPEEDAATVTLGEGWRMPTQWEFAELVECCTWDRKTVKGADGYIAGYNITSKVNDNSIFLPVATFKTISLVTSIFDHPDYRLYWTNCAGDQTKALCFSFEIKNTTPYSRSKELMIRPVFAGRAPVESVTIKQPEPSLPAGSTLKMNVSILPLNAMDKRITWTLSDDSVAYIDDKGNLTALSPGTTHLTVKSSSNRSSETDVTVTDYIVPQKVDMGLPSGTLWADRNLGAVEQDDEGLLFAWGSIYPKARNSVVNMDNVSPDTDLDAATAILGSGWRKPSPKDFQELCENCKISREDNPLPMLILKSKINGAELHLPFGTADYWTSEKIKMCHLGYDYNKMSVTVNIRERFYNNTCLWIRPVSVK